MLFRSRFLPATNYSGDPGVLTIRLVDSSTSLANNTYIDVVTNGATSAFSANTVALSTTVRAINDPPVQTGTPPNPISVLEDANNTSAVSLGMGGLAYGPGGGVDELSQTLTYTLTAIPAFISVFKADGTTAVTANTTLTLSELQEIGRAHV